MKIVKGRVPKINFDKVMDLVDEEDKEQISKLKAIREKPSIDALDVYKAMEFTCFGSLAYCCSLDKPCLRRDSVRAALRISDDVFVKVKTIANAMFVIEALEARR